MKINIHVIQECLPPQSSTDFKFGTKCQAKCNETGYRLLGPRTRECLVLGIWSGYEQFCIGKKNLFKSMEKEICIQVGAETTVPTIISISSTQLSATIVQKYNGKNS